MDELTPKVLLGGFIDRLIEEADVRARSGFNYQREVIEEKYAKQEDL